MQNKDGHNQNGCSQWYTYIYLIDREQIEHLEKLPQTNQASKQKKLQLNHGEIIGKSADKQSLTYVTIDRINITSL